MACGLHTKLEAAYAATREAFDEAHKTDALADTTLNLLFVYYQGIKKIKEELKDHTHEDIVLPDGTYDPDYNISVPNFDINDLAFDTSSPVTFGEDVLSFTTTGPAVVTVPEHEDDEKIVL